MKFEKSVFINCPFDADYLPILKAILFCVIDLDFDARIALERLVSGEPRIDKIIELIGQSKYGIHDLSRLKAKKRGEFYRLNMPFELGLDVGSKIFGGATFSDKRCLVLETERYRYQAAISDLSNSDIAVHGDKPVTALTEVRNWLAGVARTKLPGPSAVWTRFNEFLADNYDALKLRGFSDDEIDHLSVPELLANITEWCATHPYR